MKDKYLTWEIVNSEKRGCGLFDRYCWLNSACETCNPKVRFWCEVKRRLTKHQEKIITKILNKREATTKKGGDN